MPNAHSSILSYICAFITAASFPICSMPKTHSSFDGLIFASFTATWVCVAFRPMPNAHSSSFSYICASITATWWIDLDLRPMPPAHSSSFSYICASITAAKFDLCSMS